jgi:hypothetical protein
MYKVDPLGHWHITSGKLKEPLRDGVKIMIVSRKKQSRRS